MNTDPWQPGRRGVAHLHHYASSNVSYLEPSRGPLVAQGGRNSERHKIVVDWLKKIFDAKTYPCFRDEFIHPNALVPMMTAAREGFGLTGYVAATPT